MYYISFLVSWLEGVPVEFQADGLGIHTGKFDKILE